MEDMLSEYSAPPLLMRTGIGGLMALLEKQKTELEGHYGALSDQIERGYIDCVIARLRECPRLRVSQYGALLTAAKQDMLGSLFHAPTTVELQACLESFSAYDAKNYKAFLKEYDLLDAQGQLDIKEYCAQKPQIEKGFASWMKRERNMIDSKEVQHEIDLFDLSYKIAALKPRGQKLADAFPEYMEQLTEAKLAR